ncbi:MAG: TetR/AcrR family transcriptional regulator [Egibacteraceae bacterium]
MAAVMDWLLKFATSSSSEHLCTLKHGRGMVSTLDEQVRSTESRPYRMRKRAEQVNETRQRITEAAVHLHTTIGPASTTISALAEQAGVTRLTVYRHFPDDEQLFAACRNHWLVLHPPPDASRWLEVPPIERRARQAFDELYGWYADNCQELFPIYRDFATSPPAIREGMRAADANAADALVEGAEVRGTAHRLLRATAGHLVSFWTWRSLVHDHGLAHGQGVRLATSWLVAAGSDGGAQPR